LPRAGIRRDSPYEEGSLMAREAGDRYVCEKCGAALVYDKPRPCPEEKSKHSEICCGQQMKKVERPRP